MLARGDAAIEMDCDLQDNPSLIRDFLRLWEQGYHVVYGIRRSRKEGAAITFLRRVFYWLVDKLSDYHLPQGAGDFRLIDRRIIEELRKVRDPNIYLRGRIAMLGFKQAGIEYDRDERKRGESKFKLHHNVQLAMDAITSHSAIPLRLATYFGFTVTCLAALGFPIYLAMYFTARTSWPPGFATLLFFSLGALGIFSLFLGIIGEYLARLYEHVKMLPEPIVERSTGAGPDGMTNA